MDRQMDRWGMDGWKDGWMDGWMGMQMMEVDTWVMGERGINGQINEDTDGQMTGRKMDR